jgi:hypothetical protein
MNGNVDAGTVAAAVVGGLLLTLMAVLLVVDPKGFVNAFARPRHAVVVERHVIY